MKNFIQRHELTSFFLLAYLLSWVSVPFMQGGETSWGVAIAARIVIGVTLGVQGVREYQKRVANWHAGWWLLIAPLIVIGYEGIAFCIGLALSIKPILPHFASAVPFLLLVLFGGQWEELGWTGYALPRLHERFADQPNGSLKAILTLSAFRAIWHLPLVLYGKVYWFDALFLSFAIQIIIALLYDRSGGSVPVAMAFHFMSNIMGIVMSAVFAGTDRVLFTALFIAVASLFAVMLVAFSQFKPHQEKAVVI